MKDDGGRVDLAALLREAFGVDIDRAVQVEEAVERVGCFHFREEIDVTQTSVRPVFQEEEVKLLPLENRPHLSLLAGRCSVCGTVYYRNPPHT